VNHNAVKSRRIGAQSALNYEIKTRRFEQPPGFGGIETAASDKWLIASAFGVAVKRALGYKSPESTGFKPLCTDAGFPLADVVFFAQET
jgi:hypothetical protein